MVCDDVVSYGNVVVYGDVVVCGDVVVYSDVGVCEGVVLSSPPSCSSSGNPVGASVHKNIWSSCCMMCIYCEININLIYDQITTKKMVWVNVIEW